MAGKASKNRELVEGLEGLALKVVMLEEGDLPGLGAFLTHLEQIQGTLDAMAVEEVVTLAGQLETVGNKLILMEITDAAQGQEFLNQGVTLLLSWARENNFPPEGETWKTYCRLAQELGLMASEEEAPPGSRSRSRRPRQIRLRPATP